MQIKLCKTVFVFKFTTCNSAIGVAEFHLSLQVPVTIATLHTYVMSDYDLIIYYCYTKLHLSVQVCND